MRRLVSSVSLIVAGAALASCVRPGYKPSPLGRATTLYYNAGDITTSGELMSADSNSIWLLQGDSLNEYSLASLRRVQIPRHSFGVRQTIYAGVAVGAGTGLLLTLACSQVEDAACVFVLPVITGFGGILGALFAVFNDYSTVYRLNPSDWQTIRAYARFPQGLPAPVRERYGVKPPHD